MHSGILSQVQRAHVLQSTQFPNTDSFLTIKFTQANMLTDPGAGRVAGFYTVHFALQLRVSLLHHNLTEWGFEAREISLL